MTVRDSIEEMRQAVFARSTYNGKWARENLPIDDLPHVVAMPSDPDPNGVMKAGTLLTWQLEFTAFWDEEEFDVYDYQKDPSNLDSLASVILRTRLENGTWQPKSMDGGLIEIEEDNEGNVKVAWMWSIKGELYVGYDGDLPEAA